MDSIAVWTKRRNQERSKIDGTGSGGAMEAAPGGAHDGQSERPASASGITHAGGGSTTKDDKASSSLAERPTAAGNVIGGSNKLQAVSPSAPPQLPKAPPANKEREREPDETEYYWLGVQAAVMMGE